MKAVPNADDPAHLKRLFDLSMEALQEKDRQCYLGQLVRGLIHNVNGPLQNVSMLTEMLTRGQDLLDQMARKTPAEDPGQWEKALEKQRQRLERLSQQIMNLAGVLRDFMIVLEIERNQSEVDLRLLLHKLVRVLQADLFFKHEVEVALNLADELPLVRILGRDLVPSLMHLFHNCICAMRDTPQRKLELECFVEQGNIRVLFKDSGCGLDLDKGQGSYFDLFFSDWPSTSASKEDHEKHFGFGLFSVRKLLAPYGVSVGMERRNEQTVVELRIPVHP